MGERVGSCLGRKSAWQQVIEEVTDVGRTALRAILPPWTSTDSVDTSPGSRLKQRSRMKLHSKAGPIINSAAIDGSVEMLKE